MISEDRHNTRIVRSQISKSTKLYFRFFVHIQILFFDLVLVGYLMFSTRALNGIIELLPLLISIQYLLSKVVSGHF